VSLIINYQAVGSLLTHFGPVGQLILWLVTTIVGALVRVMAFLLNPIVSFLQHIIPHSAPRTPGATGNGAGLCIPGPNLKCRTNTTPQDNVAPIARLFMELLLLVVASGVFLFIMRLFFLRNGVERDSNVDDDEREALDARGLFRAQLHAAIQNLGRKTQPEEPEALPAGSVRYAYREVLRAATARGLRRASSETPDEYARRLTSIAPLNAASGGEASDLNDLSAAYNAARYADRKPNPGASEGLLQRAAKLAQTLRPPKS
ncbi:MAG: DUF4129 domain-containing protein, partial [Ktedonobacterales bacterium]